MNSETSKQAAIKAMDAARKALERATALMEGEQTTNEKAQMGRMYTTNELMELLNIPKARYRTFRAAIKTIRKYKGVVNQRLGNGTRQERTKDVYTVEQANDMIKAFKNNECSIYKAEKVGGYSIALVMAYCDIEEPRVMYKILKDNNIKPDYITKTKAQIYKYAKMERVREIVDSIRRAGGEMPYIDLYTRRDLAVLLKEEWSIPFCVKIHTIETNNAIEPDMRLNVIVYYERAKFVKIWEIAKQKNDPRMKAQKIIDKKSNELAELVNNYNNKYGELT